jgi:biopolymer transport protein ExbB/TolQ
MNILAGLQTFLYVISSALFYPVVAGLASLTFWIAISLGSFLREYLERRRGNSSVLNRYKRTLEAIVPSNQSFLRKQESSPLVSLDSRLRGNDISISDENIDISLERFLQDAELGLIKSLDKIRFAIRVGPALGLMGTLIPMGISLSALAQGDMPKMAGSMVTAFTTTVVGLACGVGAYLMSLVKEKWMRADMREMEYLTELTLRRQKTEVKSHTTMENKDEIYEEA